MRRIYNLEVEVEIGELHEDEDPRFIITQALEEEPNVVMVTFVNREIMIDR